jgi:polyisoprenoid-binding protein YceI
VTDWRCRGTSLESVLEVAASFARINDTIDRMEENPDLPDTTRFPQPTFRLRIPIATLRCGNRQMERDMNRALKAAEHPAIEFRFKELRGDVRRDLAARTWRAQVVGEINLAGERREIVVDVLAERVGRDRFRLRAAMPLRMTDFGITPPTALLGMIKAKNELVVRFDLLMEEAS